MRALRFGRGALNVLEASTMADFTLEQWRQHRHLSKSTHYQLRKRGLAPEEIAVPGTTIRRISPQADREWEEKMRALAQGKAAQQEAQRR